MNNEGTILNSWQLNAENWIKTIDGNELESRVLTTNNAIVHAITAYNISDILDIGCGEGWLTRTLLNKGIKAFGIDGVQKLIDNAKEKGGDHYALCSYEDLIDNRFFLKDVESVVINFSLLDNEFTNALIHYLPRILKPSGFLFIQTLHPFSFIKSDDYKSGWKEGSWNGLNEKYVQPYQWWFRTMEDWISLFKEAGFVLIELKEPVHPETQKPLSVIFILQLK